MELPTSQTPAAAGLQIAANRQARKWTHKELALRALWSLSVPLFRLSPRPLWAWRRFLLRLFGANIGRDVHVHPTAVVTIPWNLEISDFASVGDGVRIYNLGRVTIGRSATVSQHAHLCAGTHDYTRADFPLIKAPIDVGEGAWVCADAFVGPAVTIGAYAVLAARAVAVQNVEPWTIVGGNPAKFIRTRPPLNPR